jgi:hypothetical protein
VFPSAPKLICLKLGVYQIPKGCAATRQQDTLDRSCSDLHQNESAGELVIYQKSKGNTLKEGASGNSYNFVSILF